MINNFEAAVAFTYIDEKGNDDDPNDAGGRTSDGIEQREWDAYCDLNKLPRSDIWTVPWSPTKKLIYHTQYWEPYCDQLPGGIDYLFFDTFVNSGLHEAALILQRTLGVTADGQIGLVTMNAAKNVTNLADFTQRFCDDHEHVYNLIIQAHPNDAKFLHGWDNRISHERANALTCQP
jgi:lysozyme family protein